MQVPILYQDEDIAVVNKPPGLVVNNSATITEPTLQDWWQEHLQPAKNWQSLVPADFQTEYGSPEEIFRERGGIVHRLDKETSGVMILAKNPGSLVNLLQQFRLRQTQKMYTCLTHGKFQILNDTIQLPLGRSAFNRTKFSVDTEGRLAETKYEVKQFFPNVDVERIRAATQSPLKNLGKKLQRAYQGFSLVQCWPKTGRTHQIRVHMAHLKHPIVADQTYLGKKRAVLDEAWCSRLFLHATELEFAHPRSGEVVKFGAKLWPDLQSALSFLKES